MFVFALGHAHFDIEMHASMNFIEPCVVMALKSELWCFLHTDHRAAVGIVYVYFLKPTLVILDAYVQVGNKAG